MTAPPFTPEDKRKIEAWDRKDTDPVRITVRVGDSDLERFCDELAATASRIAVRRESKDGSGKPEIRIASNIVYRAVPLGAELDPFLNVLDLKDFANTLPPDIHPIAKQIDVPAPIRVYIAPRCPFCPQTVNRLLALAAANANIFLAVIDATRHTEEARTDQVKATPTTILDEQFRWTGAVPLSELLRAIVTRDPAELSADTLRRVLEDGRAEEVARMMSRSGILYPAYIDLLCHAKWPVRLAAMVALEYLADLHPTVTATAVDLLRRRFETLEDPIKGDLLHALGTVRTTEAVVFLKAVAAGPYSEAVKHAAAETLHDMDDFRQ